MGGKTLTDMSKMLAYYLRHAPEKLNLTIDSEGWVSIEELERNSHSMLSEPLTERMILMIASVDTKGRYALSEDGLKIRAVQGHSTDKVDLEHPVQTPPDVLYHGTADKNMGSISVQGLHSGSRHYVHLSEDVDTARTVGTRHGKPIIYSVDCARMLKDGHVFRIADNNVWLIESVPPFYLTLI